MDRINPPEIRDEMQPYYTFEEVQSVLKSVGRGRTFHGHRDRAIILVLFDTGVRAAELVGMRLEDIDWNERSILVTGKKRQIIMGHTAAAIDKYMRKRSDDSP